MRTLLFIAASLWASTVCGQEIVYFVPVQCCPGGCCPPRYYHQPQQQQCPPVGSLGTPRFVPVPPSNPPLPPQKPPTPDVDWDALDKLREKQIADIRIEINNLNKQVNQYKECNCAEKWAALELRLKQLEANCKTPPPSKPLDYDVIAAEVAKRLTHSATITLLDGSKKTQTKPLTQPLEFIQRAKGVK